MQWSRAYLSVRDLLVYYESSGEGEPVVLLHGGFGTVEDFASQTPELAKRFRVVAFERPGHGRSADDGRPFSYVSMAEHTVDFMQSLGLKSANLIGWSDGAVVALLVAISRPDMAKRIVSVGGMFDTSYLSPTVREYFKSATPESFMKDVSGLLRHYFDVATDGHSQFPALFEKTMRMWLTEPEIRKEELAKITAPALVMAGDRDAIPIEHTLELFRSIKGAQLCIVPGSTHFLLTESPDLANGAIMKFLLAEEKPK
jgi:pimeloyl-ACP methyl ester carboxylesterase